MRVKPTPQEAYKEENEIGTGDNVLAAGSILTEATYLHISVTQATKFSLDF